MVTVTRACVLAVAPPLVWALVRDFNAMPEWNATVISSRIENGPSSRVGCRRVLTFEDGSVWTHELTELGEERMEIGYRIVATPMPMRIPVWDYRATIKVDPDPGQSSRIVWRAEFQTDHAAEMSARAGEVFERGFDGLRRRLLAPDA